MRKQLTNPSVFFLIFLALLLFQNFMVKQGSQKRISYSEFQEHLVAGRIVEATVSEKTIVGVLKKAGEKDTMRFSTTRVDPEIAAELTANNVKVKGATEKSSFLGAGTWIFLILGGLLLYQMTSHIRKGGAGSYMSVGKSKAKIYAETDTKVTFAEVAGADEAKEELIEVVNFLRDPVNHGHLGARLPKGVLLVGPPGTGKTLLAKAVAGEAKVPFFSISGSEFVEMFVGVGASRVRDLFKQAREKAPCIIFIDELDALGRARGAANFHPNDEKEQTLNQLLVELDGFDTKSGIVILSATNRPEILDPALLRSGRFDRQVLVDRPDKLGRKEILKVHLKRLPFVDPELDIEAIAEMTTGFSGADIENLVNEAALTATREKESQVNTVHFEAAVERIVAGLERKNRLLNPKERKIVAYHEMGHAIVGAVKMPDSKLQKVSIIPRGIGALGYTIQRPTEDRYLMTKQELKAKITMLLGGRAAESLIFKHLSTGASDDIAKATDIARGIVLKYGMVAEIGSVSYENDSTLSGVPGSMGATKPYSEKTAEAIDQAVRDLIFSCEEESRQILERNVSILHSCADKLLAQETLNAADLTEMFVDIKPFEGSETLPNEQGSENYYS